MIFITLLLSLIISFFTSLFVTKNMIDFLAKSWLKISEKNYKNAGEVIKSVMKDRR